MLALKPGKFYGKALPRPRIYDDVKFSGERVDPPAPVNMALMDWAGNAHWSMGGLAHKRKRMQGKIEGRISRLRLQEEEEDAVPSPPAKKRLVKQQREQSKSPSPLKHKRKLKTVLLEEFEEAGPSSRPNADGVQEKDDAPASPAVSTPTESPVRSPPVKSKSPVRRMAKRVILASPEDEPSSSNSSSSIGKSASKQLRRSPRISRSLCYKE